MAAFGLGSLAWRTVRARPVRATLTATGIALGVAVLYAGVMTNIALERSADRAARGLLGRADLRVSAFADAGLAPDAVTAIGTIPGVVGVSPAIERRTYLAAGSGVGVGVHQATLPPPVTVLGIDPAAEAVAHDIPLAAGAPLGDGDRPSALISERLAHETGLMLGDEIAIDGSADARPADLRFRIVGFVVGDGPLPDAGGRTIVVRLDRAQAAFRPTGLSRLDVVLGPGGSLDSVAAALASRVDQPYLVSSRAAVVRSLQASTTEFGATTALVAAVALFAGAFLIFNTLSMTVAERVRDVGLLRAAGATRRQVVSVVLAVAAILGTIGSLAGVALGAVVASLLTTSAAELAGLRTVDLSPAPAAVAVALVSGVAVTIAAAVEPAIRASRIPPVEALKPQIGSGVPTAARIRWLVAVFAAVGLVGLLLWPAGATLGMLLPGAAAYGVLLVVALTVPWLVAPLGRLAGIPFGAIFRAEERFARGSLARDRSRAALTVGALAVALAAVVALGGVASDARGSAESWIAGVVPGDVLATSVTPRGLDDGIAPELAASPSVAHVTPIATFDAAFRGLRLDMAAVVGSDFLADGRLAFVDGDRTAALRSLDATGTLIAPRALAARLGLHVGDSLAFPIRAGRTVILRLVGIVERSIPGRTGETVLVGWPDATAGFGIQGADAFAVRFAPSATDADRAALADRAGTLGLRATSIQALEGSIAAALGHVFGLFDALATLAVVIAGLGIANTLAMNVLERARELGVLRAVGMTRRQVWRMVVVEAGVLGLVGAILGVGAGVVAGAVMRAVSTGNVAVGSVPWGSIVFALVLGLAVSMLAAAYPAWLAGRGSIVRAVGAE